MGLDINGTQCILYAHTLGVDFTRTAMIGRQGLHLSSSDFKANLLKFGYSYDDGSVEHMFAERNNYAETFFRSLGSQEIHSIDYSDYEGATHVHDMNAPIPESFKQQYTVVVDSGSLEHIFNFPIAIKNCMEMVCVGGHYIAITPANNFMGHGFYQFSPEVFFSIFLQSNGYELDCVIAFEDSPNAEWYLVKSPASANSRVAMINSKPIYLLIVATRISGIEPFHSIPQQRDYTIAWNRNNSDAPVSVTTPDQSRRKRITLVGIAVRYTPRWIKDIVWIKRLAHLALRIIKLNAGLDILNPHCFTPLIRTDGVKSPNKTLRRTR
jgi:hypothetical protein